MSMPGKEISLAYLDRVGGCLEEIAASKPEAIAGIIFAAWEKGARVFTLGNGGSAATASHLANDLAKATAVEGKPRLKACSLADNVPLLTALANDLGYENAFVEQLRNLMEPGDVVIALTVSGTSPNVVTTVRHARSAGATVIGLTGCGGGVLADLVDAGVFLSCSDPGPVEDAHLCLGHLLTYQVRELIRQA